MRISLRKVQILFLNLIFIFIIGCENSSIKTEIIVENETSIPSQTLSQTPDITIPDIPTPLPTDTPKPDYTTESSYTLQNKQQYLNSISYLNEIEEESNNASFTNEENQLATEYYEACDYELNRIYGILEQTLPEDEMEILRIEQREWIKERDKMGAEADEFESGSYDYAFRTATMASFTKERIYELVDFYFEYIAMDIYREVLQNDAAFFSTDDSENYLLNKFNLWYGGVSDTPLDVTRFAVVDMDGDNISEVVLELTNEVDGSIEILHYDYGTVYGYATGYRAFNRLKKDGSYGFSSSAAESGFQKMRFMPDGYQTNILGESVFSEDGSTILYYIGETYVSEERFYTFCENENEKEDVEWHEFTEENIETYLYPKKGESLDDAYVDDVYVDNVSDDFLNQFDTVYKYMDVGNEGESFILWTNKNIQNFSFIEVGFTSTDYQMELYEEEILYTVEDFSPNTAIVIETNISEGIPTRGISYIDENGEKRYFTIGLSGLDLSISLDEFENKVE